LQNFALKRDALNAHIGALLLASIGTKTARSTTVQGAIRVTLPISVANDLEKFQTALANVAARVGHPFCTSGVDVTFVAAREFAIDARTLDVSEGGATR